MSNKTNVVVGNKDACLAEVVHPYQHDGTSAVGTEDTNGFNMTQKWQINKKH